jgi:uncharacterized protein
VTRPVPSPDADSAPYWAAARAGRLELQRCRPCGLVVFYPRARCPRCHAADLAWETLSGRGTVHAYTIVHRAPDPSLEDAIPYVVALVDLDEGARLMTNIVDCAPEQVRIGLPVVVRFRPVSDAAALPLFGPLAAGDHADA